MTEVAFHFNAPDRLGHKALAVNLSDLAAMGAAPVGFTLALALPSVDEAWLAGFAAGLFALADASGCELLGGDTTRGPLTLSITAIGEVAPHLALRRDRARPGDDLWVSGSLGGAAFAVREALREKLAAKLGELLDFHNFVLQHYYKGIAFGATTNRSVRVLLTAGQSSIGVSCPAAYSMVIDSRRYRRIATPTMYQP